MWVKRWLVLAALWSIPGLIQATSTYAVYSIKGDDSLSLLAVLAWRLPEWQVWALLEIPWSRNLDHTVDVVVAR